MNVLLITGKPLLEKGTTEVKMMREEDISIAWGSEQ